VSRKTYKTAQGKSLDLGALQLQNESVRAVGNMGVNARGDKVSATNTTVESRTQTVNRQYKKQVNRSNVSDDVVVPSKRAAKQVVKQQTPDPAPVEDLILDTPTVEPVATESADTTPEVEQPVEQAEPVRQVKAANPKPVGGLADAIAKAKSVKQEPLKTPRQQAQEKKGVKRI